MTEIVNLLHRERLEELSQEMFDVISKTHLGNTEKYPNWESILEIMSYYYSVFDVLDRRGCQNVLDFGCGFGMARLVHKLGRWKFDLTMADFTMSWHENEKKAFDTVLDHYNFDILRFTNVMHPFFKFVHPVENKFDAVVTIRFPPISRLRITPTVFKERLSQYCKDDFYYVYLYKNPEVVEKLGLDNEAKRLMQDTSHIEEIISEDYMMRIY